MGKIEEKALTHAELKLLKEFNENHQFTIEDICHMHKLWLGKIYPSAGKYRTENEDGYKNYISAIHQGVNENYDPIQKLFLSLLEQSAT